VLALAKNRSRPEEVREQAVFWLGQLASEKATAGLTQIVDDNHEDLEIREAAIFSLSQRGEEVGIPTLTHIATTSRHPQLREHALFWLAQYDDPRVIDFFEQILLED
jgi:HEAT repeat protein